jgi:hypothetical protein
MGTISIFSLEFSGTPFAVSRNFSGGYTLRAGDYTVTLTPDGASAFAQGGARIRLRAKVAAHYGRELKPGATFRRDLQAVDGRVAHVEFGVTDAGDVYLEVGSGRMALAGEQSQHLLFALDRLAADTTSVYRATAP